MKARPILFSGPMVRALLDGRKTQTRRIVKPQPPASYERNCWFSAPVYGWTDEPSPTNKWFTVRCPYGQPDDLLWVREAFSYETLDVDRNGFMPPWYWADGDPSDGDFTKPKPSIHMPRWASRLTLEVTDVRAERLLQIDDGDAFAEGIALAKGGGCEVPGVDALWMPTARGAYHRLWARINGEDSLAADPWVWTVSFRVHQQNIDAYLNERAAA